MTTPQKKLHLLIIEDDMNDFRRLRRALRERNPERYVVRHAPNIDQAIRLLSEERFSVILLDDSLPDISVDDQIALVVGAAPDALILVLGTDWDVDLATQSVKAGARDFLLKDDLEGGRLAHAIDIAIVRHEAGDVDDVQNDLYEKMLNEISELAIVVNSDGYLKSGHQNLIRTLGHQPADLHFRSWVQLLHPGDHDAARTSWNAVIREPDSTPIVTARLPRADGTWCEYRLRLANYLKDPAVEGVLITGPDISQATQQEAMFKRLSEVSRSFLAAPDPDTAAYAVLAKIGATFEADDVRFFQYEDPTAGTQRNARLVAAWRRYGDHPSPATVILRSITPADVLTRLQDAVRINPASGMVQIAPRREPGDHTAFSGALILAPILIQGGLWGVVAVTAPVNLIDWPEERRTMLRAIVDTIGMAFSMSGLDAEERPGSDHALRILDRVGAGLILFDRNGQIQHANQAITTITGIEPGAVLDRFRAEIESGTGPREDQMFKRPDGSRAYARIEIMKLVGADAEPEGGVITVQDVTNLYRAQRKIREAQVQLQAVVSTANVAILTLDSAGRLEAINPAGEQMFGIRSQDAIGRSLAASLPQPASATAQTFLHEFLDGLGGGAVETREHTLPAVRADGREFRVAVSVRDYHQQGQRKLIASIRDVSQHEISDQRIALQLQQLEALHRIDRAIANTRDQQVILNVVADQVVTMPDVDVVLIRSFSEVSRHLDLKAVRGLPIDAQAAPYLLLGQGAVGRAAVDRQPLKLMRLQETLLDDGDPLRIVQHEIGDGIAIPLISNSQLQGTLEAYRYDLDGISSETRQFLTRIASQAALAVDETNMVVELERSKQLLEGAYETTLEGWSRALELRGVDTKGHIPRVTELAVQLGRAMGLRDRELLALRRGAFLHDIGKIAVPDSVLHKPGKLSEEDWVMIRQIPHHAMNMLSGNTFLRDASVVPYFHNEKWDGSGYPNGLSGETIPIAARIFAVVDVWDTLISDRPYRDALPRAEAIEQLKREAGSSFDPSIVEAFLRIVSVDEPDSPERPDAKQEETIETAGTGAELDVSIPG